MKNVITFITLCCIVSACDFSKGTRKDLTTGLSITYNGFAVGEAVLTDDQNQRLKTNEVNMDQSVKIIVQGIERYEVKDGKTFPGLNLVVTDKNGNPVLDMKDALNDENGYSPELAAVLSGTITVGDPMKSGETYHAALKIWDKLKPESVIDVEVDLVVK